MGDLRAGNVGPHVFVEGRRGTIRATLSAVRREQAFVIARCLNRLSGGFECVAQQRHKSVRQERSANPDATGPESRTHTVVLNIGVAFSRPPNSSQHWANIGDAEDDARSEERDDYFYQPLPSEDDYERVWEESRQSQSPVPLDDDEDIDF